MRCFISVGLGGGRRFMAKNRVCPWWIGYFLASPIRRMWQDPAGILEPYVRTGMTVLEPGPGMGFFTLELARRVGPSGHVVAVDIQSKMLDRLRRRLAKAGLQERVEARLIHPDSMAFEHLNGAVDFVLAFAVVHEMPSPEVFFRETAGCLKVDGRLLLVEPAGHVTAEQFETGLKRAEDFGLHLIDRPIVRWSRAALLKKAEPLPAATR